MITSPIYMIFVFLGPLWWTLVFSSCVGIIYFLENGKGTVSFFVLLATLAAMVGLGNTPLISFVQENPNACIAFLLSYFLIGAIWCIIRWKFFVKKKLSEYNELKINWLKEQGSATTEVPEELKGKWYDVLYKNSAYSYETNVRLPNSYTYERAICIRPMASRNKARIGNWIGYWPWSLVWWILADAITSIVDEITYYIMGWLEEISIRQFKSTEDDYRKN